MRFKKVPISIAVSLLMLAATLPLTAQEGLFVPQNQTGFHAGITLGSDILPTGTDGAPESWTRLAFSPDFSIGKFGIGLDLTLRFMLYPTAEEVFKIYEKDWIPDETTGQTFLDVYLPKLLYIRYGLRGVDPFYVKLGSMGDLTLGNGFIIGDYSNMRFLPEKRLFGGMLGLDGAAFGFPYLGFELLTGNLARFDVIGGRVYLRPLAGTKIPLLKGIQIGASAALDRDPYLYDQPLDAPEASTVGIFGADLTLPIISGEIIPLTAYADGAREPNEALGFSAGVRGKLLGILTYNAGLRYLQQGFIPAYFDAGYDLYRAERFIAMQEAPGDFVPGWLAGLGTSLFKDKLYLWATLDAPFGYSFTGTRPDGAQADYAHIKAAFGVREGLIPNIYLGATYEKYFIGRDRPFLEDVIDPTDAAIGIVIGYKVGASMLALNYDAAWNPAEQKFDVRSSLSASIKF